MEAGMMATYTIYSPFPNSCPVEFGAGDFWHQGNEFSAAVRNTSNKTAPGVDSEGVCFADGPAPVADALDVEPSHTARRGAGAEVKQSLSHERHFGLGSFPYQIVYADGSKWEPEQKGECFQVYWRDEGHPTFDIACAPPFQMDANED
jgi:hypothetical protein